MRLICRIVLAGLLVALSITQANATVPNGSWSGNAYHVSGDPDYDYHVVLNIMEGTPVLSNTTYVYVVFGTCTANLQLTSHPAPNKSVFAEVNTSGVCVDGEVRVTYNARNGKVYYEWWWTSGPHAGELDAYGWLDPS